jgi:hypothetical protein
MEEGLRFAIREGGRTVGAGVVAKIIDDHGSGTARSRLILIDRSVMPSRKSASASRPSTTS